MRSRPKAFLLLASALAFGLAAGAGRASTQEPAAGSLAIVVNRNNPVADLSFDELRLYFLGERTHWPGGRRVIIVMPEPPRPERDAVLRLIYDMREQDFHAHFLRAKFTGENLEEPVNFETTSRLLNFVFLRHGAIGCVRADEVGPTVKVLRVDGLAPGDPNYKLNF